MTEMDTAERISIADASALGVPALVRQVEEGREQVILRDDSPVAVVISAKRFEQFQRLQEDLADLIEATSQLVTTGKGLYALSDVVERLTHPRQAHAAEPDEDRSASPPAMPAQRQGGFPSIDPAKHPLLGKWRIVEMDLWDQDYLDMEEPAYIEFTARGRGEFVFGLVHGSLDLWYAPLSIDFTWVGSDEMEETSGSGSVELDDDGTLIGEIHFHSGDETGFKAQRW